MSLKIFILSNYQNIVKINKNYAAANYRAALVYLHNFKDDINAENYALKNRFEKSLILSIEPPQYETRLAIIERKLFDLHTSIDEEVMKYMAENITTDVRKIEGAIRAYLSVRDLMKITPDVEQCEKMGIFNN